MIKSKTKMNEHQKRHQALGGCNGIVTFTSPRLWAGVAFKLQAFQRKRRPARNPTRSSRGKWTGSVCGTFQHWQLNSCWDVIRSILQVFICLLRKKQKNKNEEPQRVFTVDWCQRRYCAVTFRCRYIPFSQKMKHLQESVWGINLKGCKTLSHWFFSITLSVTSNSAQVERI